MFERETVEEESDNSMEEKLDLTGRLSAFMAGEQGSQLPQPVVKKAKIHILDAIGAMLSGSLSKPGRLIVNFVREPGGPPQASVVASDIKTSVIQAALANSTVARADETDDAYFSTVTYRSSVVMPATLAIVEREHRSGRELFSVAVLGYGIICRVVESLGDRRWIRDRGQHTESLRAVSRQPQRPASYWDSR